MEIIFDDGASKNKDIQKDVEAFTKEIQTLESAKHTPIIVYQDGKSKAYYIKCGILAAIAGPCLDTDAKLNSTDKDSFRANRQILTEHYTYKRMVDDATKGREFNDIIVEYNTEYVPEKPLKVWGGQHRVKALQAAFQKTGISKCHGFKIYFGLSKSQRTEIALISNTNIEVSNDLFDRLLEETEVGLSLRKWCVKAGLLKEGDDFPDQGSRAESITIRQARTFVTNFYKGKGKIQELKSNSVIDNHIYEPYLCQSGASLDPEYQQIIDMHADTLWKDKALLEAGNAFATLHKVQYSTVKQNPKIIANRKGFRNKALTDSVLSAWAYVAGLLQNTQERLQEHYKVPRTTKTIVDPLNAKSMSAYSHDYDEETYRGLGTRSGLKDRQRMAQLFLARSKKQDASIDKELMDQAVNKVFAIKATEKAY